MATTMATAARRPGDDEQDERAINQRPIMPPLVPQAASLAREEQGWASRLLRRPLARRSNQQQQLDGDNQRRAQTISRSSNLHQLAMQQQQQLDQLHKQQQYRQQAAHLGHRASLAASIASSYRQGHNIQNNNNNRHSHSNYNYYYYYQDQQHMAAAAHYLPPPARPHYELASLQQAQQQQQQLTLARHRAAAKAAAKARPRSVAAPVARQAREQRPPPQQQPLCKCRVIYLGSSVPHVTKNGLHGIQEPLKHLYPEEQFSGGSSLPGGLPAPSELPGQARHSTTIDISHLSAGLGIDSWISVWSNGLLLENVDELGSQVSRFFAIDSLHYCAAVRHFNTARMGAGSGGATANELAVDQNNNQLPPRPASHFLPLDAPIFRLPQMLDPAHPPVFAAIMRRTSGVKVLECHAFICRRDAAANALVRCCTQAYGDLLAARRLSLDIALDMARGERPRVASQVNEQPLVTCGEESNPSHSYARIEPPPEVTAKAAPRKQGSSRSLFADFSPDLREPSDDVDDDDQEAPSDAASFANRRLSRSLDHLLVQAPTCCGSGAFGGHPKPAAPPSDGAEHYSVVRRRHSRSLQSLEAAAAAAQAKGSTASRRRRERDRKREHQQQHQQQQQVRRRSASVHEMQAAERIYEPPPTTTTATKATSGAQDSRRAERRAQRAWLEQQQRLQQQQQPPPPLLPPPGALYLKPAGLALPVPAAAYLAAPAGYPPHFAAPPPPPQQSAASLARFMRLSPPLSYLRPATDQLQLANQPPSQPEVFAATTNEVVSGEPGFVASAASSSSRRRGRRRARGAAADDDGLATAGAHQDQRKLGWLKRLSLTISPASWAARGGTAASEEEQSPPAGAARAPRKRASLFAGSLTLGRGKRQAPIASAVAAATADTQQQQ